MRRLLILRILLLIEWQILPAVFFGRYTCINKESLQPFVMGGKRYNVALFVLVIRRWQPVWPVQLSTHMIASTRDGLYLEMEAEIACETPLEGER